MTGLQVSLQDIIVALFIYYPTIIEPIECMDLKEMNEDRAPARLGEKFDDEFIIVLGTLFEDLPVFSRFFELLFISEIEEVHDDFFITPLVQEPSEGLDEVLDDIFLVALL